MIPARDPISIVHKAYKSTGFVVQKDSLQVPQRLCDILRGVVVVVVLLT
jgi:hypothetical protein